MLKSLFKKHSVNFQRFTGNYELVKIDAIRQQNEYDRLKKEMAEKYPGSVALFGKKVYSQTDEDGIIEEIFNRIPNNKSFLEIGVQNGTECNSLYLLLKGWKGMWIEGNPKDCKIIEKELNGANFKNKLSVVNAFVDRDNIVKLFRQAYDFLNVPEIDFFSLDIDGNDYYIMEALLKNSIFPKVVCVEYNAKFEPPLKLKIKYNRNYVWDWSDYLGCSLQSYVDLFQDFNYTLVCCNITGINAFFVRNDFAHEFKSYSVTEQYQPYRFYLSPITLAQKPSLNYLRDQLEDFEKV